MTQTTRNALLFLAPLVNQTIFYLDIAAVRDGAVGRAMVLDTIRTLLFLTALREVLTDNNHRSILVYLVGNAVGSFLGMQLTRL